MQGSSLTEIISSGLLEANNALAPKSASNRITAYVESDEDVAFWRNILHEYESDEVEFEVLPYSKKGKQQAIERRKEALNLTGQLGKFLIVCVDSDYDYLLPEHTEQSKFVNRDPYIFHTYAYSLENLQCFSGSLHPVCVQATKYDKKVIDFSGFLKTYSKTIYRLFLWNLYFRKNDDHDTFTVTDFCTLIKLTDKVDISSQFAEAMAGLKNRVETKVALLEQQRSDAIDDVNKLGIELKESGLEDGNAYLFIQGHTLKNNVVLMVLKPICDLLVSEKFAQINNDAQHKTEQENNIKQYKNQRQDISTVLSANTEFKSCFLYKKIKADLDNYIANFSPTN